jgi:hypothetical protein
MFDYTQCIQPPHPVEQAVSVATRLVSEKAFPIKRPTACMNNTIVNEGAIAIKGAVFFRLDMMDAFSIPKDRWNFIQPELILHEVLHQIRFNNGLQESDTWLEEGIVEAVTFDLLPTFMHRLRMIPGNKGPVMYPDRVKIVRIASAKAVKKSWVSPAARRWRIKVLISSPAKRLMYFVYNAS